VSRSSIQGEHSGAKGKQRSPGTQADEAVGTCRSGSKDRRLAPKPPLLSAKIAQGNGGAGSFFLVGRHLPAYILLLVAELCRGRSLEGCWGR